MSGDGIEYGAVDSYSLCEEIWATQEYIEMLRRRRANIEKQLLEAMEYDRRLRRELARRDDLAMLREDRA